jgi:RNA polymerase sigma factor (sigma-70 family)
MVTGQLKIVGSQRGAAEVEERLESLSDEELLDWFLNRSDGSAEAAFRAIVVRHGPMVLGVCRHILNQLQDAEDAFQATFLVLARKAGTIRDRRVLARWLYEVAYRIAMRARTNGVRRRTHERQGGEMAATVTTDNHGWIELRPVLHEEINRLPEKYRAPVILCYLEGKTNEEVAELLEWPVGTVKGRLSRARDLLRSRLSRRGLALTAAFLVTALKDGTVIADVVPPHLLEETVSSAMSLTRGLGAGDGTMGEESAIPPAVAQMMAYAAPAAPAGVKLVVVGVLLLAISGAFVSVGLSSGLFESVANARSFLSRPTPAALVPGSSPAPSPAPTAAPAATGGGCHSDSTASPSSHP